MIALWLRGVLAARSGRLLASVMALALAVALLAALGTFISSSVRTMTQRAVKGVPVHWQILLAPGADRQRVTNAMRQAGHPKALQAIGYADTLGLAASAGGTTQTTGAATVIGVDTDYAAVFANQFDTVLGASQGVLIATQTAANLHVTVGDTVSVLRQRLPPADLRVDGVVSLRNADSMFQAIGVPRGTAPQAPPGNLLVLPATTWHTLFDAQAAVRPDTVRTELHALLDLSALPQEPSTAYAQVLAQSHNLEARVAGSAAVANNLAARLDGVRADAMFARVMFLFLGAPGVLLAFMVALAVSRAGSERRRAEQGLLRVRGASVATLVRLAGWEALAIGGLASLAGLVVAGVVVRLSWSRAGGASAAPWFALAAVLGLGLAAAAFVVPAWRDAKGSTVAAARSEFSPRSTPLWQWIWLDPALLVAAAVVFWNASQPGYSIVLATEGVAQTSVHYEAFLAPLCLWLGTGLLWLRVARFALRRGITSLPGALYDASGLWPLVAASMSRQNRRIAAAAALAALAFAFGTATAIFNTTYDAQSRVDAELTNGADVNVSGTTAAPAAALMDRLRAIPGVAAAEPLMHRMAYVGTDLQDIFGIDPAGIGRATTLADAFFGNGDAAKTLDALHRVPDGVLVSAETVNDFQLRIGDELNLRLQDAVDHRFRTVRFHFVGIVNEFPGAPKDSFLVANASYLAAQTRSGLAEVVLLRTAGAVGPVARSARVVAASVPGTRVTTLGETQALISSSLTAVDLRQLTRLELGFSTLLIAAIAGIVLGLNLAERRRSFALLTALGARRAQVGAFIVAEGAIVVGAGLVLGTATGIAVAKALVSLLAAAFDPPPAALIVPWAYLTATAVAALGSAALAVALIQRLASRPDLEALRGR